MNRPLVAALLWFAAALPTWADEISEQQLTLYPTYKAQLQLADAASATSKATPAESAGDRAFNEYHPPLVTANKLHKYLGLGSITLATLALLAPKDDIHGVFGAGAAALGGAAVVTGLTFHWDDVGLSKGVSDPDNLHAIFATMGAAGFIAAASMGGESDNEGGGSSTNTTHATLGVAGYASMLVGIRIAW